MKSGKVLLLFFLFLNIAVLTGYTQEAVDIDTTEVEETDVETRADPTLGACMFKAKCADCHGAEADGRGASAAFLKPLPADFTDSAWIHGGGTEQVVRIIREGVEGTAMAGFANVLTDDEILSIATYLTQLSGAADQD